MSLQIKSEETADVAVLHCVGKIVRAKALYLLKAAVTGLTRPRVIVLDFSDVKMLDAGGLGMLVFLHCWARHQGIQLTLVNPSSFVLEMLEQTQLTGVLHISSVADAMDILCKSAVATESVNLAVT
jgi:anti-anti-sigma factor